MPEAMEKAKELLLQTGSTCVLCRDTHILMTHERGVRPLLRWLDEEADTWACCAADRVVGKGAAMLYCLLGVRQVYGQVVSMAAVRVLRKNGVEVYWDTLAESILNRSKTGLCPIEAATAAVDEPEAALPVIRQTLAALQSK